MLHYIYILTDSNRKCLHVGATHDLSNAVKTCSDMYMLFLGSSSQVSRLVHQESFANEQDALTRFDELKHYTRMQKERLIRRNNPDWVDISQKTTVFAQKSGMVLFSHTGSRKQTA